MRARSPSAACIAAMLSSGSGEFSGTSIQVIAGVDQRGGGLDGAVGRDAAQDGDQASGHGALSG